MDDARQRCLRTDIPYELDAMERAYHVITSDELASFRPTPAIANVFVENFWLHARNLTEFFETKLGARTVSPQEFTDDRYTFPENLAKLRDVINAQITHIQLNRSEEDKLQLAARLAGVRGAILKAERHFVDCLSEAAGKLWPNRVSMTLERAKAELMAGPPLSPGTTTATATNHVLEIGRNYFPITGPSAPKR